jgi:hypothetical protein
MGSALNSIDAAITASPALESNIKQLGVSGAMIPSKLVQKIRERERHCGFELWPSYAHQVHPQLSI